MSRDLQTPDSRLDPSPDLTAARQALVAQMLRLAPHGGLHASGTVPGLVLFRSDKLEGAVCGVYQPCVALVVQGAKQVVVGGDTLVYDCEHFFVTSLELPAVATLLQASPERPYLALVLELDLREMAGLLLGGQLPPVPSPPAGPEGRDGRAMGTARVTAPLLDTCRRLLDLVDQPEAAPLLAPLVLREFYVRLLMGEAGARLRQMTAVGGQGQQVARAIGWLKEHYARPLRVDDLAREVRMSASSFHHHFKAMTAMSPLQYQKQLRLAEARRLMLVDRLDAATAAYRVGYESPSQFSREYSRHFGAPPMRDIAGLRTHPPREAVSP